MARSPIVPNLPGPRIAIERGIALYWTTQANLEHRPHLVKILVPAGSPLVVSLPEQGARLEIARPILIDADTMQQIPVGGARYTIFVDPETAGWRARSFLRARQIRWMPMPESMIDPLAGLGAPGATNRQLLQRLSQFRGLLEDWPGWGSTPQLPTAIRDVAAQIVMTGVADRDRLARSVGLSARRLTREFQAAVGLTLRRYSQWAKLSRAILAASLGTPLVEAGAVGGFSDQPHFTRSLRDLLGSVPSSVPFDAAVLHDNYYGGLGPLAAEFIATLAYRG